MPLRRLSEFKLPKITIICSCGRKGVYDRDRSIEWLGDIYLKDFVALKASACPRWHHDRERSKCGAGCDELIYMFMAEPFTRGHGVWQEEKWREKFGEDSMCNLYNVTTSREAVLQFTKAFRDKAGWNQPSLDVYPGYQAPVVRVGEDGQREIASLTWGMPSPPAFVKNYDPGVTNIRNVSSPHWRRWLGPTSRCVVPFTSFAEPDPARKVEGGRVPNAWFAGSEERPLMFFAGFWTPWKGVRKVRDGEREYELFGFLTTSPNEIVSPIHQKAMPAILTTPEEVDLWLTAPWEEAKHLQRPLPGNMLVIVEPPAKPEDEKEPNLL